MKKLQPLLEAEGLAVFYHDAEDERGLDQLIIPLAKEDGSALNVELNTLPDPHGLYPTTQFIQCFISLTMQVPQTHELTIRALINDINLELPIGSFNFHESGIVFYKYTIVVDKEYPHETIDALLNALDISNHLFQSYEQSFLSLLVK